jgi:hypothetical protein
LLNATLSVQANMFESHNGQSQIQCAQCKPKGRFTGQRLKLIRPDTYRRVVELLAEPREQVPYYHICRSLHVSEHTVYAIEKAESVSIAERKQSLLRKALRIASKAADRIEDQIDKANITQSTVAFGVLTDKIQALSQTDQFGSTYQERLAIYLQPRDVAGEFNAFVHRLEESVRARAALQSAPPDANPPSPPPPLTDQRTDSGATLESPPQA